MEDYTREEHVLGRDARKRGASLGHHLSEQLRINKYNRMVRALRELHEKQEAERLRLGLPPPVAVAKSTKEKTPRAKKTEAPPPKPSRTKSNPDPKTEYTNALDQKYIRGQTWRAHDMLKGLKIDALAKSAKAQTIAAQLAAAVVDERKSLATTHTDIGEASLRAKSEAAYRAEARAQSLKASASKFDGVEERARANFAQKLTESRNETYANHERRENAHIVRNLAGHIYSLATDHARVASNANLTRLANIWSRLAAVARSLENSVEHTKKEETASIINHLGTARNLIEQASIDNEDKANEIKKLIAQAQTIEIKATASTRNKAGFKRTKKHRKKRRKTRNNRTNKFVARKH